MIEFSQMVIRLIVALILGSLMGFERELAGKQAGIRTSMMVAGGSALFSIAAISMPFVLAMNTGANVADIVVSNSGFLAIIANIVIGIGFLGAGIIIKTEEHVHGLTTAAVIWTVAAVGVLSGIGLLRFAIWAAIIFAVALYTMRRLGISEQIQSKAK